MKDFFENIGFTFGSEISDIKPSEIIISENQILTNKLKGYVFAFKSPAHTNTSFYVITISLTENELFEVKRYIWNENKFDLYFIADNSLTTLYYAKSNPYENDNKIASFNGNDNEELEKIKKWSFNSGTFWLNYSNFLDKVKQRTRIDKKLIEQLTDLKKKLKKELDSSILNKDEIVQALIDRTLFIKFLEDNHIINSFFYNFHFPNLFDNIEPNDFGYKALLKKHDKKNINVLFEKINKLFNSILFKSPEIEEKFLTNEILNLIYDAIRQKDWKTGQLSLFDFRFDVIPIEFISHIYEVFLENTQLNEGIYYTPDKLAQLIIDDTVDKIGTILDPACGSGMFLVLAFRKILEFAPSKSKQVDEIIEYKSRLLKEYIFGIEKEKIAWRLSIFSLYLEILKDINPNEIKNYIKQKLKEDKNKLIFPIDFSENILNQNSLETEEAKKAHKDKTFDFIVGNPPFFEIKENDEEINFINEFELCFEKEIFKAKNIVGYKQISQAFMLKLKDWAKPDTRFGFVQNSSNFYNELSENFQKFFFEHYQIENFYELSRVKNILFRKAKESVIVTIFNNRNIENNTIDYYPVDLGIFSETFDLLIIQEDKKIEIKQQSILNKEIILRDYLIGNDFDLELIKKIKRKSIQFKNLILEDNYYGLSRGMEIVGKETVTPNYIKSDDYNELTKKQQKDILNNYKDVLTRKDKQDQFDIPYIEVKNIDGFQINGIERYLKREDIINKKFRRNKAIDFFEGERILYSYVSRMVNSKYFFFAIYSNDIMCVANDVFTIRLKENANYYLITAFLNSDLVNYYLNIAEIVRSKNSYPKINISNLENIPIPKNLDEDLVSEITEISKQLTEGKLKYEGETKEKLNELIYDLYDLNILEINRIKDFYEPKRNVTKNDLEEYKTALSQTLRLFFVNKPEIEYYQGVNLPFGMVITAIYFDNAKENNPQSKKGLQYIINKILQDRPDMKFITMNEKIYGKNCVYIVKDNQYHSWSTTKAFEDGQDILKKIIR